ncbi:WhiB family transcriptional regulator [Rhodococcus erythropolis]|uniref:WhiB family transcriptional regulator n=1 Tax=Rhodococcus erythropolis TaxID=1833 RepID=UPI001BED26A7|nr:WhiB family transcriptional regulator [Rhodococcus erythropolis]MBT2266098.1 WhiB family transcriptional regulator [Rhodococcus erythropolis]
MSRHLAHGDPLTAQSPPRHASWQLNAGCRDSDPNLFFEAFDCEGQAWEQAAKAICSSCTVRRACLDYALDASETSGIWGGLNPLERRQYKWFHSSRSSPG